MILNIILTIIVCVFLVCGELAILKFQIEHEHVLSDSKNLILGVLTIPIFVMAIAMALSLIWG